MDPPELASEPAPGYARRGEIHASGGRGRNLRKCACGEKGSRKWRPLGPTCWMRNLNAICEEVWVYRM